MHFVYWQTGCIERQIILISYDILLPIAAGCVLGQAGKKGAVLDSMHSLIPGWNDAIKDDVTESAAYMVGHVACAIAFPEIALARDFSADVLRGDPIAAALDSLGYLGVVKNLLKSSGVISAFVIKNPGSDVKLINGLYSLKMAEGVTYVDKFSWYDEASGGVATWLSSRYGTSTESMERIYIKAYKPLGTIKTFLESSPTTVWADSGGKQGAVRMVNDYEKHVKLQNEWGNDIGLTLYREKAINLLSRRDSTVEVYYQKGYDTLVIYDRNANELVSGTINGDIVTFFRPDNSKGHYVDDILRSVLIRIN